MGFPGGKREISRPESRREILFPEQWGRDSASRSFICPENILAGNKSPGFSRGSEGGPFPAGN